MTTSAGHGYGREVNRAESDTDTRRAGFGRETRYSRGLKPIEAVQSLIGFASGYFFLEVSSPWSRIAILLVQVVVVIVVVISQGPKEESPGGGGDPQPPRNPWWRAILIQAGTFLAGLAVNYVWDVIKERWNPPGLPES